jgi:hypothetical protein
MDDDFFKRDYDSPHERDNLFGWTVFILLLSGFALACWIGSFYVFGHPENPRSYGILLKLKKLDPLKRFDLTAAPTGEFLTPQKIYEKYATMPDAALQRENTELLRNYILNYQNSKKLVPYLVGRFTILKAHELGDHNLFSSGVVALAQAVDYPQVLLEHIYTSDAASVPQLQAMLTPGLDIKLEKTLDLSAIIHIERLEDGRLQLTAVPLLYGTYALKQGTGSFSLEPPGILHLETGVPIIKSSMLPPAARNYATIAATPPPEDKDNGAAPQASPPNAELVRVLPPQPISTPKPGKTSSTPKPAAVVQTTPAPAPSRVPVNTPAPIVRTTPVPAPAVAQTTTPPILAENITPIPLLAPTTTAAPGATPATAVDHPDVPLQPFLAAKTTPALNTTTGSWKTFRPGQMPRGRLLKASDAASLADRGTGGERIYLSGQFVVTASGESRAVLRSKGGLLNTLNPLDRSSSGSTRILVEYPAGYLPPAEGTTFSRDELRPFEIRDVQRAKDGTINVYVREITTPE